MTRSRLLFLLPALIATAWLGWWLFGRPAEQQVMAAQMKFITAVEDRDWKEVKSMLADEYTDAVGHDRDNAVGDAEQVLGSFLFLALITETLPFEASADRAGIQMKIQMEGRGLGISPMVMDRVNSMHQPWQFDWHKQGPWPWSWKITRIHHDELYPRQAE